ncbi:cobalamin biosynthesis protein [Actinoallomurus sp. CA-150999]|uniref:cobalamin biosynthesis protein n=1 Tax=Actinoallomurus sp. CA-150999 TaxID=3239887 RepID=UPI003D8D6CD2
MGLSSSFVTIEKGLCVGLVLDALVGDPRRGHPVAAFGRAASALERRLYADSRARGAVFAATCVLGAAGLGFAADAVVRSTAARTGRTGRCRPRRLDRTSDRAGAAGAAGAAAVGSAGSALAAACPDRAVSAATGPAENASTAAGPDRATSAATDLVRDASAAGGPTRAVVTAVSTWAVLGGTSLGREGVAMAVALEAGDVEAARRRLPHLCGRDPSALDAKELARATVESIAENTSDAAVAPLFWGSVFGVPGLLAYRAVNTLDAMVGHRSPRYLRFGWAAARLDDAANWAPAQLTGLLTVVCAPLVGGSPRAAYAVLRRDGAAHPSPNAGRCEAAFAGALGVRLGGVNVYGNRVEHRPELGDGRAAEPYDIRRAVRLSRAVTVASAVVTVGARAAVRAGWRRLRR